MDETFDFSRALHILKAGHKVSRLGWNGKGMWIKFSHTDWPHWRPFLFMKTVDDQHVPWVASQTDLLADDWILVEEVAA